jgi:hypothetical protein
LPVVLKVLAAPEGEPLRQICSTLKPVAPAAVNWVLPASQSRWPALGVRAISYHLPE